MASSQRAKPSFMGDLLAQTWNFTAGGSHNHRCHGLLSPTMSISKSHEDGEEMATLHEKTAIHHLAPLGLAKHTTPETTPLLTSHSPSSENVQDLASGPSNKQPTKVGQQPSSFPTPCPCTPPRAKNPQSEPPTPKKPFNQINTGPSTKKARRMAHRKVPTPPTPFKVSILARSDRDAHPYATIAPKYAFTIKLDPGSTIRELRSFAGDYVKSELKKFVDKSRLEARDGNGYVFSGTETIGQELGEDGQVYLIEDALDVEEARKAMLRNTDVSKQTGARTPKVKKVKEPRKTPSQRNQAIAEQGGRMTRTEPRKTPSQRGPQEGRVARSEPKRRSVPLASLDLKDRSSSPAPASVVLPKPREEVESAPESLVELVEDSPPATTLNKRHHSASQIAKDVDALEHGVEAAEALAPAAKSAKRRNSNAKPTKQIDASASSLQSVEDAPSTATHTKRRGSTSRPAKAEDADALAPAVASQRELRFPTSITDLPSQDERVIPDSQDPPSQLIDSSYQDEQMASKWKPINASRQSADIQPRSVARPKASKAQSTLAAQKDVKQSQPGFLTGRPDPYDISAVLSDDEYYSPRQSNTIMSSSVPKLGTASKRTPPAPVSIPRNSLLIANHPPAAGGSKSPVRTKSAATSHENIAVPSTPLARAPPNTPTQPGQSYAPAPLLSSPTNHVAAALARGRAKARRQPHPECVVIEDSDVEGLQDVLDGQRDQVFPSRRESRSIETSLPWSAPPLRMGREDPFWTLRTTGRRTSIEAKRDANEEMDVKIEGNRAVDVKRHIAVPVLRRSNTEEQALSTSGISSFNLGSPVKESAKRASKGSPRKSPTKSPVRPSSQATSRKSPLLLVHGSSSSEQGVEEIGFVDAKLANSPPVSPSQIVETAVIHGSSSQGVDEDEDDAHDFMSGALLAEALFGDEPIEPHQIPSVDGLSSSDEIEAGLPVSELPSVRPMQLKDHHQIEEESFQVTRVPETDPKSDNALEDTPPSGQPCKRKRELNNEADAEEERRIKKKARHDARTARKAEKKRLRKEKRAQEVERQRQHQTWLQEERKRLAMEKAYRRARDLEIVVSSPSKAAEMGLNSSDTYDSSELGSSPPVRAAVLPVFEESDDSFESEDLEERQSWRKLSKRHLSASPSSSLKDGVADSPTSSPSPSTTGIIVGENSGATLAGATGVEAEVPQEVRDAAETKIRFQSKAFEDWAFLETTLGTSVYSPLQTHYSIHMQMVQAVQTDLQVPTPRGGQEDKDISLSEKLKYDDTEEELAESQLKRVLKSKNDMIRSPSVDAQDEDEDEDEDGNEGDTSRQTIRSPAPSPKDMAAAPAQALEKVGENKQRNKDQKKSQRRKTKDNTRKRKRRLTKQPGLRKKLNQRRTFGGMGNQQ